MRQRARVLVSGASIGGPAVAYWLARAGFTVTVVEQASQVRGGGYPIDIRGAAVEVVRRMGLLDAVRERHIDTRRLVVVDRSDRTIAVVPSTSGASQENADLELRDLELPRGELTELLYRATAEAVEYVFDDSIAELDDVGGVVEVRFRSGRMATYDLVVGADGLHSNTRRLVFGPEQQFHRYLGHCYLGFSVPNRYGLDHEAVLANAPGRMAALYAAGNRPQLHALLAIRCPQPSRAELADPAFGTGIVREAFDDDSDRSRWLTEQLELADDPFFDTVSQIVMPDWSRGRVTLIGDAAAAPSFLSGEGTSLALVGGYALAAELAAAGGDVAQATRAYHDRLRDYVRRNQAIVSTSRRLLLPDTRVELALRNAVLRLTPLLVRLGVFDRAIGPAANAVELPEQPPLVKT